MLWLANRRRSLQWLVSRLNSTYRHMAFGGSRPCRNSKLQQIPLTHCHATMCFVALCSLCLQLSDGGQELLTRQKARP